MPDDGDAHFITRDIEAIERSIRDGRFARTLAVVASGASFVSGLEVAYEHYKGSYSERVMYTPIALSAVLGAASAYAAIDVGAGRRPMRAAAAITLLDAVVGFYFHIRGVARKPGGWSLPLTNVMMGPPLFAPLLFGTAAYLALIASFLRREDGKDPEAPALTAAEHDLRHGKFQRHLLAATALSATLSGTEAWYSHEKSAFRFASQYWPIVSAPVLALACVAAIVDRRFVRVAVPVASFLAIVVSGFGTYYHVRGIVLRPGGMKTPIYNILYGPPIFAPMLFGAAGAMGLLASRLRRAS